MSEDIKRQVLAHLKEQQAEADAREDARKSALEAAEKRRQEELNQYFELCSSVIEPAMAEFQSYLEGQAITGRLSKALNDRPYPAISFAFSSKEPRILYTVEYRHTGGGELVEVRTKEGHRMFESGEISSSKVSKETVQKTLLDIFKKLRI